MKNIKTKITKIIKKLYSDESGSAIILALIIIAGLAGTGIGAARLAKSNTQQAGIYEDSLKAFYAAEAGIESAMLEWRFDHNVEFWNQEMALKCFYDDDEQACESATVKKAVKLGQVLETGDVFQVGNAENMSACFDEYGEFNADLTGCGQTGLPRNEAWYEMEISYRNPKYPYLGNIDSNPATVNSNFPDIIKNEDDLVRINKDESMEISFPVADEVKFVNIWWNADLTKEGNGCGATGSEECKSRLLVHPVVMDETGQEIIIPVGKGYLTPDKYFVDDMYESFDNFGNLYWMDISSSNYEGLTAIRLKCQSTDINGGCYVGVEANKGAGAGSELVFMPQKEVVMKVTGHFNDVERTLEYRIDRQSGTIMDIFDHGVYSRETLRK